MDSLITKYAMNPFVSQAEGAKKQFIDLGYVYGGTHTSEIVSVQPYSGADVPSDAVIALVACTSHFGDTTTGPDGEPVSDGSSFFVRRKLFFKFFSAGRMKLFDETDEGVASC